MVRLPWLELVAVFPSHNIHQHVFCCARDDVTVHGHQNNAMSGMMLQHAHCLDDGTVFMCSLYA